MSTRSKIKRARLLDYDSAVAYQPGQSFYYPASTSPANLYYVIDYTNAGETPASHPAKFSRKTYASVGGNAKIFCNFPIAYAITGGSTQSAIQHNKDINSPSYFVWDTVLQKNVTDLVEVKPTTGQEANQMDVTPSYDVAIDQLEITIIGETP